MARTLARPVPPCTQIHPAQTHGKLPAVGHRWRSGIPCRPLHAAQCIDHRRKSCAESLRLPMRRTRSRRGPSASNTAALAQRHGQESLGQRRSKSHTTGSRRPRISGRSCHRPRTLIEPVLPCRDCGLDRVGNDGAVLLPQPGRRDGISSTGTPAATRSSLAQRARAIGSMSRHANW